MRTSREAASDLRETVSTITPLLVTAWRDRMPGTIKKT